MLLIWKACVELTRSNSTLTGRILNANLEIPCKYLMSIPGEISDISGTFPEFNSNEPPPALSSKQLFYHSASPALVHSDVWCRVVKWHLRRLVSKARVKDLRINLCVLNGVQYSTAGSYRSDRAKTGCPSNSNDFKCTTVHELTTSHMRQIKCGIDKCIFSSAHDIVVLFIPD